jgi:drug/metabolite transporter (DMT)-like permease
MGFFHTFPAYILYFEGIKQTNPSSAGVVFALSPIITILLEGRLLGLLSAPIFYMGGALIISGAITVITQRR